MIKNVLHLIELLSLEVNNAIKVTLFSHVVSNLLWLTFFRYFMCVNCTGIFFDT